MKLVNADAAKELWAGDHPIAVTVRRIFDDLPEVDAVPVVYGKWVCVPAAEGLPRYQCSQCGRYVDAGNDRNYCPHCGARMINVQDPMYKFPLEGFVEIEKYNELREAFIGYVCSGVPNPAPYCKNRCEECVDGRGWCKESFCKGFCP